MRRGTILLHLVVRLLSRLTREDGGITRLRGSGKFPMDISYAYACEMGSEIANRKANNAEALRLDSQTNKSE